MGKADLYWKVDGEGNCGTSVELGYLHFKYDAPKHKRSSETTRVFNHDTHNLKVIEKAKEFKDRESMIKTFIETRTHLVIHFHKVDHSEIRFFIGNDKRPYTYERYLKIFLHHDKHHKKQIENLLG